MKDTLIQGLHAGGKIIKAYFGQTLETEVKQSQSHIVTKAGAKVTDYKGEEINFEVIPETYKRNFEIAIAPPSIHPELIELIRKV